MEQHLNVQVLRMPGAEDLPLPSYQSEMAAAMDLHAAIPSPLTLPPGAFATVPTGIAIAIPSGYEGQVRPRSGLAARHGVTVLNSPGTIDADYRGELRVILVNLGPDPFVITRGMRIAQLLIASFCRVDWEVQASLPDTTRGTGGLGHTGQ